MGGRLRMKTLLITISLLLFSCGDLEDYLTTGAKEAAPKAKVECCCITVDNLECCAKVDRCSRVELAANMCECKREDPRYGI